MLEQWFIQRILTTSHLPILDQTLCGNLLFNSIYTLHSNSLPLPSLTVLTAFTRFTNFLECVFVRQSKIIDWKEWQYYVIPSTEIEQQSNSVDCGVSFVKWAQHIAEGRPLDFSQKQINDFRYSLISDVANGGPLCSMSTEPDHHSVECYSLFKDSVIDTNSSCTSLKGKAQKTHYPSYSDSAFESPKKRPKKDPESNSHITPCNTTASHIDDHTYAKDADQADSSRSHQIPQSVQKVLPTGYQYSCHDFREIPSQNFTGAPQENLYVKLSVSNITAKEGVDQWLQQFTTSSNIKYNAQGGYK